MKGNILREVREGGEVGDELCEEYVNIFIAIREVVVTAAAVTGAIIAVLGLKTWQKQLRGRTEYDLARRMLRAALEVRDGIRGVRSPFISPAEMEAALRSSGLGDEEIKKQMLQPESTIAVYNVRWKRVADAVSSLQVETLEGEVLWGDVVKDRLKPLYDAVASLRVMLNRYFRAEAGHRQPLTGVKLQEVNDIMYETSDDPQEDKFTRRVHDGIAQLESFLKPKLHL